MNQEQTVNQKSQRILSVDALRGFDMFWIIGGGAVFASLNRISDNSCTQFIQTQLRHVEWEGFRFEDLIMPLFLFIVGVVMPFAFNKRLQQTPDKKKLYLHIIKRTIVLFILGMIAQGRLLEYDLSRLHIYCNTLQAIAAGYLFASIIILNFRIKTQAIITVFLLLLFWVLMTLVPVPGRGPSTLTPDGNLAIYIDKLILGRFQDQTVYTWILSGITFTTTVMLGAFAGYLLNSDYSQIKKTVILLTSGIACVILGYVWGFWFPIIKHLWTSSFVLFAGGFSLLLLGFFYLVIDVIGLKKWAFPFIVIGSNAITVYMATSVFYFGHISSIFVGGLEKYIGNWNGFVQSLAVLVVIWLILFWMYRKKIFIKI